MPRSDTLSVSLVVFGMTYFVSETAAWVCLVLGLGGLALYVITGRLRIVVHYAGWGSGPDERFFCTVTEAVQAYVDSKRNDVKASTVFFGEHYQSPRMLKVIYSRGRWGEKRTRLFEEHKLVLLV